MRILLFSTAYLPYLGGAELALKEITDRLPGVEFDLITAKLKRGLPEFERIGNVNIYRLGTGNGIFDKPLLPNLGFLKALSLNKERKYNLIHGIMASQGSAAAYLFKFFNKKIPFVLTLQEGDLGRNSPFDRFWQRRIIRKADAITAISGYLADFAGRFNKKVPIFVVPNGVDLEKFQITNNKLQINSKLQNPNQRTIITVSRLVKKNGIDILIRALHILNTKYLIPDTELLIIGDGKERKKLEKLANKLKLNEKVKFLGNISHEELPKYLVGADVFARPSRSEGLGTAFLEAMAAGVPVIGTPVGGIPDFLKDPSTHSTIAQGGTSSEPQSNSEQSRTTSSGQATGLFCEPNNPEDLAEKIKIVLNDKELRESLIKNSQELVQEKYNWSIIAGQIKKIYAETVNRYSGI